MYKKTRIFPLKKLGSESKGHKAKGKRNAFFPKFTGGYRFG